MSKSLPTQIDIEIHALAGSSATVGNQEMHRQATALEQIINHAISLAPNDQHSFLLELDNGLMALEQQFKTQYDESLSSERFIVDLSIQSSQEDIAAAALELADITPDSQLAISSIDNIPVFCDGFFYRLIRHQKYQTRQITILQISHMIW